MTTISTSPKTRKEAAALQVRASLTPWLLEPLANKPTLNESWVYFIQVGTAGPIKIGKAASPIARLAQLQVASPSALRLIGAIPGDITTEHNLHNQFSVERLRGEWFTPSEHLLSYLEGVLK